MTVARKVLLATPRRDGGRDAGGGGAVLGWAGLRRGGGDLEAVGEGRAGGWSQFCQLHIG